MPGEENFDKIIYQLTKINLLWKRARFLIIITLIIGFFIKNNETLWR